MLFESKQQAMITRQLNQDADSQRYAAYEKATKALVSFRAGEIDVKVNTQNQLARFPLTQAISVLHEHGRKDVAEILLDLYPAVLPFLVMGHDGNPIHHTAIVVNFMSQIAIAETTKEKDSDGVKITVLAALFHDIGLAQAVMGKITEEMIENALDEHKGEMSRKGIEARLEHMNKGAVITEQILRDYRGKRGDTVISADEIEAIVDIVRRHDYAKIPLMQKVAGIEINTDYLFDPKDDKKDDYLIQLHWEADSLWMLDPIGIEADFDREGKTDTPANRIEQFSYNLHLHRDVMNLYVEGYGTGLNQIGYCNEGLLYYSRTAYEKAKQLRDNLLAQYLPGVITEWKTLR